MNSTTTPATPASSTAARKRRSLLINRSFALLFGANAISYIGDFLFSTTLVLWIATTLAKGQPWAPLAVSGVLVAQAIPDFLVGPFAGVFVDRWDKRRTMLVMDALRAIVIALLLLATNIVPLPFLPNGLLPTLWQLIAVYAAVLLAGCGTQFFTPARMALIGDIVEEAQRARATGLLQVASTSALILGPALAGPLFFAFGARWALILNALSFVVSYLSILLIRAPRAARSVAQGAHSSFWREFGGGVRFFAASRILRTLLITGVIIMFAGGAINALDVFFVTDNLHAPASVYAYIEALTGAGLVLGAILSAAFASRIGAARTLWLSLLAIGASLLVYSRLTSVAPALVIAFFIGFTNAPINVAAGPLMLHRTPRELVGRVSSLLTTLISLASLLSIAGAGYLESTLLRGFHATLAGIRLGPVDIFFAFGGVLAMLAGVYALINLRGVRLAGEPGGPPAETEAAPDTPEASDPPLALAARE